MDASASQFGDKDVISESWKPIQARRCPMLLLLENTPCACPESEKGTLWFRGNA